jgi:hypothetical protein
VTKNVTRFPNEQPGESLMDLEERELMKKFKKVGAKSKPAKKKTPRPIPQHVR